MKKLRLFLFITLIVTALSITISAATYGDLTYSVSDGKVTITDCKTSVTSVAIPEKIDGYPVTSIGSEAFAGCTSLTSVTIPNSVTSIGDEAFSNCIRLKEVHISDIASWLNIRFSDSYANPLRYADNGLYINGEMITDIVIPNSVTSIGSHAFYGFTSLTSVTIPNSVTSIGNFAFYYCTSLTSVTIPNSVTSIGSDAFYGCKSLVTVYNNSNLSFTCCSSNHGCIAYYTYKLVNKDGSVVYRSGYTDDGNGFLFDSSNRLCAYVGGRDTVTLPDTYKGKAYSIYYMRGVINVIIPEGVTSIGDYAFEDCGSLTSVTIPNSVTSIGSSAFRNCTSLKEVHIPDIASWLNIRFSNEYSNPLCYADMYINGEMITDIVIPNSVTSIGSYAFEYCGSLTSVTIPNSVTSIGDEAFRNCTSLKEVHISDIASWLNIRFSNEYSNPLYYADNGLYINGEMITDIVIPNSVTSIGNYAFCGCTSLTSVTIPNSVTSIGYSAFSNCSTLKEVHISDIASWLNIRFSGSSANPLYYADNGLYINGEMITDIVIPNSVTSIGPSAFYSCTSLTSVTIPNSVTSIGDFAFSHCTSLTSVTIPNSVTSIGYYAFRDCTSLASVTIPQSVKRIGSYAIGYYYDSGYKIYDDFVIRGYTYSYGEKYANDNGIEFVSIGKLSYPVTFNANGGDDAPEAQTKVHNETLTLTTDIPTRTDYTFKGWATSSSGSVEYSAGGTYTGNSAVTLYAVWEINKYSVTYNANGGDNAPATQEKIHDKVLTLTNNAPTLKYYKCVGWSTTPDGEVEYTRGGRYENEEPITLYAVWKIDYPVNDSCGANARWTLDSSGVLTISGSGAMDNWNNATETPWYTINYAVKSVVIGSEVTSVSARAFEGTPFYEDETNWTKGVLYVGDCLIAAKPTVSGLYRVAMGTRLIACDAFIDCDGLTDIVIPESVTSINSHSVGFYYDGEYKLKGGFKVYGFVGSQTESHCLDNELWFVEYDGYYGDCGTDVVWELVDGVLTISGNGEMADYTTTENAPWKKYIGKIKSVVISEGVTTIGKQAFHSCTRIESVTLPDSLESIGAYAFYKCEKLTEIAVPESVTSIGNAAFSGCDNIVINCSKGSYAETYAKDNGISYKSGQSGDVNGDNVVDLKDVTTLRRYLAGGYSVKVIESALDVNVDGTVDLKDVTYLRRALAGGYGIELN